MSLRAYSIKTAGLSIGFSLEGWKISATTSTTMPRGSATAPIRVVIASSPPTCRAVGSRASITFPFPRGPCPSTIRLWWSGYSPQTMDPRYTLAKSQEPLDIERLRSDGFQKDIFQAIFRIFPARLRPPNLLTPKGGTPTLSLSQATAAAYILADPKGGYARSHWVATLGVTCG